MKFPKVFDRNYLSQRTLYVLLAVSIVTNVIMMTRFYYSREIGNLLMLMQSAPVATASDHIRGNPSAKNTVIVYTDYQCPYCAQLHAEMLTLVKENDVRWIYRNFPLDFHTQAKHAAEAAECAGDQGNFWEYSDALFNPNNKIQSDASFTQIASDLSLNLKVFEACLSSGKFSGRVAAQREDGINRKIMGTPVFFVNKKRFDGVIPIDQLKQAIMQ